MNAAPHTQLIKTIYATLIFNCSAHFMCHSVLHRQTCCGILLVASIACVANRSKQFPVVGAPQPEHKVSTQSILAPPGFHGTIRPCGRAQQYHMSHDAHGSIIREKAESYGLAQHTRLWATMDFQIVERMCSVNTL